MKKMSMPMKIVTALVITVLLAMIIGKTGTLLQVRRAKAELLAERALLEAHNADRNFMLENADDDGVLEKVARENGMRYPDEEVYEVYEP
ncbi:MAG: hypothetical protein LBS90_04710 [Oscillospiraceae bacterium]|nr:hypothetical protein [Oscillospiraceae bacterium]